MLTSGPPSTSTATLDWPRGTLPGPAGDWLWRVDEGLGWCAANAASVFRARFADRGVGALLGGFDPAITERVWSDPRAYRLMREVVDGRRPAGDLASLVLGAACMAGRDVALPEPWSVALPATIVGSPWVLEGASEASIVGVRGGELVFAAGSPGVRVRSGVVARHRGFELPLEPEAFRGLAFAEPALAAGPGYQAEHVALVERALAAVAHFAPAVWSALKCGIRLAALKPRRAGDYDNFSHAEMPGAFIASVVGHPLDMAEGMVHELQHNRLQGIEEAGPLFVGDGGEQARFYSPWREKARGLYGVFHGVFVFLGVLAFWRGVWERRDELCAADRAYALDRLVRLPRQLALAVGVLRRHAVLAPLGQEVFARLQTDVVEATAATSDAPPDAPAWVAHEDGVLRPETDAHGVALTVRQALRAHLRRNDAHGQAAGLVDL